MPTALTKSAEDALATFRHHDALAIANRQKANAALERFLSIISYGTDTAAPLTSVPQCVKVWTRWLVDNGPATRQAITKATGTKFTERGTPHTLQWEDIVDPNSADIPENTIIRFTGHGLNQGRGAKPVIYALWSQRYDVLPKFGVGPVEPDPLLFKPTVESESNAAVPLLGIVTSDGTQSNWGLPPSDQWEELTMDDLYNADDGETQSNENGDSDGE